MCMDEPEHFFPEYPGAAAREARVADHRLTVSIDGSHARANLRVCLIRLHHDGKHRRHGRAETVAGDVKGLESPHVCISPAVRDDWLALDGVAKFLSDRIARGTDIPIEAAM